MTVSVNTPTSRSVAIPLHQTRTLHRARRSFRHQSLSKLQVCRVLCNSPPGTKHQPQTTSNSHHPGSQIASSSQMQIPPALHHGSRITTNEQRKKCQFPSCAAKFISAPNGGDREKAPPVISAVGTFWCGRKFVIYYLFYSWDFSGPFAQPS